MKRILKAKVIPFRLSKHDTMHEFLQWNSHPLSKKICQDDPKHHFKMFEVYVPFWIYDVALKADYVAKVGYKHKSIAFSHQQNQYFDLFKYRWRVHHAEHFSQHRNEEEGMQVYCSNKIWEEFTDTLKGFRIFPGRGVDDGELLEVVDFDEDFLSRNSLHIEQIKLRPSVLWPKVLEYLEGQEMKRAEIELKAKFTADIVEISQMEIQILSRKATAVFVPAYLFNYDSPQLKNLIAVVSGWRRSKVSAIRQYSTPKVFLSTLGTSLFLSLAPLLFAQGTPFDSFTVALFTLTPAIFAAWLSRLVPFRAQKRLEKAAEKRLSRNAAAEREKMASTLFDDEDSFGYVSNLFQERFKTHQKTASAFKKETEAIKRRLADPLEYYSCLGLASNEKAFTPDDIRTAFRMKAHQWHPDRFAGGDAKDVERRNFEMRKILKAYSVLKNQRRKKLYDEGVFES